MRSSKFGSSFVIYSMRCTVDYISIFLLYTFCTSTVPYRYSYVQYRNVIKRNWRLFISSQSLSNYLCTVPVLYRHNQSSLCAAAASLYRHSKSINSTQGPSTGTYRYLYSILYTENQYTSTLVRTWAPEHAQSSNGYKGRSSHYLSSPLVCTRTSAWYILVLYVPVYSHTYCRYRWESIGTYGYATVLFCRDTAQL